MIRSNPNGYWKIKTMAENNRRYLRTEIEIDVELSFGENTTNGNKTQNLSEGGMFIVLEKPEIFPLGDMVIAKYNDPLNNDSETTKDAVIVRVAERGIAIAYIDLDAF